MARVQREGEARARALELLAAGLAAPLGRAAVGEVMEGASITLRPDERAAAAAALLARRGAAGAPVVDADGVLIGSVDLAELILSDGERTVAQLMHTDPPALPPDASLTRAAAVMAVAGRLEVAVVDERRRLRGAVTALGILRRLARDDGYLLPPPPPPA